MNDTLKVGIIGANKDRGWARLSHVPAVQQLRGLELAAVATGSQETADAAAQAFGAAKAYGDAEALINDPEIDLVAIAVKVPDHRKLVLSALKAGKHLYCEYPLGRDLRESRELAQAAANAAEDAGVHVAIGLQTRANPAARHTRDLLAGQAIGRVLSAHILSTTVAFGPEVEDSMSFGEQSENGVTLVTIQGAHTLDTAIATLGDMQDVSALLTTQFSQVEVGKEKKKQPRTTPDHMLVQARCAGIPLSIETAGGRRPEDVIFRLSVVGERGSLTLEGGALRGFQSGRLRVLVHGEARALDEGEAAGLPDEAANVAGIYVQLRDDIRNHTRNAPDFNHAVRLARLIEDLSEASHKGRTVSSGDWPAQRL